MPRSELSPETVREAALAVRFHPHLLKSILHIHRLDEGSHTYPALGPQPLYAIKDRVQDPTKLAPMHLIPFRIGVYRLP